MCVNCCLSVGAPRLAAPNQFGWAPTHPRLPMRNSTMDFVIFWFNDQLSASVILSVFPPLPPWKFCVHSSHSYRRFLFNNISHFCVCFFFFLTKVRGHPIDFMSLAWSVLIPIALQIPSIARVLVMRSALKTCHLDSRPVNKQSKHTKDWSYIYREETENWERGASERSKKKSKVKESVCVMVPRLEADSHREGELTDCDAEGRRLRVTVEETLPDKSWCLSCFACGAACTTET